MNDRRDIDIGAHVRWFIKMFLRCMRMPFCVMDFLVTLVANPNIFILLVLLFAACGTGALYRSFTFVEQETTSKTKEVPLADTAKDKNYGNSAAIEIGPVVSNHQHGYVTNAINNTVEWGQLSQILNVCGGWCPYALCCPSTSWEDFMVRKHEDIAHKDFVDEKNTSGEKDWLSASTFQWSMSRMFDYGEVLESWRSGSVGDGVAAILLFLFTWLIGGGGLVGSIITTMKFFHEGGWRRCSLLLWNHTVILGWDDNGVTVIREHIESRKFKLFSTTKQWAMPERIVVLTNRNVDDVKRRIDSYLRPRFWKNPTIRYDIYRGEYDDANELGRLNLSHANGIYVLGEEGDRAHDARVLMLPQAIGNAFGMKKWFHPWSLLMCLEKAFIPQSIVTMGMHLSSFGLYSQMLRMEGESKEWKFIGNRIVNVAYRNFYDSWAKRLFANYWSLINSGDNSMDVRLRYDKSPRVHFVIVGFSEMGQALAVQAARVAHYGDDVKVYITVFDDEIEMREIEFRSLFPRIDEVADVHWTFMHDAKVGSDMFMEKIVDFSKMGDALTVAIACEDSAEGMKVALPIYNKTRNANSRNIQILLRQDVIGRIMPKHEEAPVLNEETPSIRVYGMRDGSGYNAWFRDESAISLYSKKNGVAEKEGRRMWCKVHMPEKCQYEMLLDVMEETYEVLDVMEDDGKRMKVFSAIRKANEILDDPKEVIISSSHIATGDFSMTQLMALEFVQKQKRKTRRQTKYQRN